MNIVPPKYKIRLMRQINAYYVNLKQPHTYYSNPTPIIQTPRLLIIGESFQPRPTF